MSSESPPAKAPKTRAASPKPAENAPPPPSRAAKAADAALVLALLGLTFLLGLFPLKDTDFWWHLRTGDLIRQSHEVPVKDYYTYTSQDKAWVDLHWTFQVAMSWLYERGGVPLLTLAKSCVTCVAVFLLLSARRRFWPIWAAVLSWLPALLVLSGRNYVRPETLTLLYLSAFLAILTRIGRRPWLAFLLPVVQLAWVNAQGLFVLGPILLGCAWIDAAARPGAFAAGRGSWWRSLAIATGLTGLACFINPYGITGAFYPLQIAATMNNPLFSRSIAELTPIPLFIERDGLVSLPLQLHLATMVLGALSFLVPIVWTVAARLRPLPLPPGKAGLPAKIEKDKKTSKRKSRSREKAPAAEDPAGWSLSAFRLLLFVAFSVLSWKATRNSHQFAAVVGAVTAWNFAEWASAVHERSWKKHRGDPTASVSGGLRPRIGALGVVLALTAWVATGGFYRATGEGRVIGLGEQPLWFPREAVKFTGTEGMPDKFLGFHIGHASLYDYYFGPERKVYVDARLEVIGAEMFEKYMNLQSKIIGDDPGWPRELDAIGRPAVLADHEHSSSVTATMLNSRDWKCVWFDPIAAVFVHDSYSDVVSRHGVDFAARHFHPDPATEPAGAPALLSAAKGLRNVASPMLRQGADRVRPLALLGMDYARRLLRSDPASLDGWKLIGQFEGFRELPWQEPIARFRSPFDPVFDLSVVRATYAMRRALEIAPDDFMSLLVLSSSYQSRAMDAEALPILERMNAVTPINGVQASQQQQTAPLIAAMQARLGAPPKLAWENLGQLGQVINGLLAAGRVTLAAEVLERASPPDARSWEDADRIATWRLHLGEPALARAAWRTASAEPRPGMREARVAATHLVEGDFDAARQAFRGSIAAYPELFEARYGLAVLEQDAGRAAEALTAARDAEKCAGDDASKRAARGIIATVTPYASSPLARDRPPAP